VLLCAGAVQSPQILQLSGIGDAQLLAARGIAVRMALPGVGRNLQDHLQMRLVFRCEGVETLNDVAHSVRLRAREFIRYLVSRSGALSHGVYRAGAFFRVSGDDPRPDVQVHFGLVSFDRPHQPPHRFPGVTLSVCLLRPASRGTIEVTSDDALAAPRIRAGYLQDPADRALAVSAVERVREIAASPPLARHLAAELEPGPARVDRASLLSWTRQRAVSIFHPVGTCAMGSDSDPAAVLDHQLRVRGVDALRVVDGSVMPTIVSGNTNAPIVMIAERAADLILARVRAQQPPSGASSAAPSRAL
jgi:choline dehydrogenase